MRTMSDRGARRRARRVQEAERAAAEVAASVRADRESVAETALFDEADRAARAGERPGWWSRSGRRLGMVEAMTLGGDARYVVVARERRPGYYVSTAWLGYDMGRGPRMRAAAEGWSIDYRPPWEGGEHVPQVFETAVFGVHPWTRYGESDPFIAGRTFTERQARQAHAHVAAACRIATLADHGGYVPPMAVRIRRRGRGLRRP